MDELLIKTVEKLTERGFKADKFLFPEIIKGRLIQQEIIIRDKEIQNDNYVGKTITDQDAFSSGDLPNDIALIFDSSATFSLQMDMKFSREDKLGPFTPGVCGYINTNPIVKNTQAVIAINGIRETLMQKANPSPIHKEGVYINLNRIDELRAITSPDFDLSKLIRFCEELNICFTNECYLAITMLTRAILDHIPPIFSFNNFNEVANNYGGSGESFKKSMKNLQSSLRNIANSYLHLRIRRSESLPNSTQVDFSNDLDVLLAEIVRVLK